MSKDPLLQLVATTQEISDLKPYRWAHKLVTVTVSPQNYFMRDDTPDRARRRWKEGKFGAFGSRDAKKRYERWLKYLAGRSKS